MDEILAQINRLYGLQVHSFEKVAKGFLTENHVLIEGDKKYFLKRYRFDKREKIEEIHSAKKYFADDGIPIILPIVNKENSTFFFFDGGYFALFPFVVGRHMERDGLTDLSIISLGEMLARIHLLGKDSNLPIQEKFQEWDKEKILAKFDSIIDVINKKEKLDDFDKLALKDIEMRQSLVETNTMIFEDLNLQCDHLIHGDYHKQNVFFDEYGYVFSVFDLEKVMYAPRMFELIRSIMIIFFGENFETENISKAKLYLHSYLNIYPASLEMLQTGFKLYYLRMLHGSWIQNEHYLKNNNRVDVFLLNDFNRIKYLSENYDEFESKLFS